jgi:hypothetical protein
LVEGEEEYSMEKILDSQLFSRRWHLQYLVKWDGYPDSDNMWVDKDDIFADDKVQEFKQSNPNKRTHIRLLHYIDFPHLTTPPLSHLLTQHTSNYMSSDGNNKLAYEPTARVYADSTTSRDELPVIQHIHNLLVNAANACTRAITSTLDTAATPFSPRPCTLSAEAAEVTNTFQTMSIHIPARLTPEGITNEPITEENLYEVSVPQQTVVGYEDHSGMASETTTGGQTVMGSEELTVSRHQSSSHGSSAHNDLSPCPQCGEP